MKPYFIQDFSELVNRFQRCDYLAFIIIFNMDILVDEI